MRVSTDRRLANVCFMQRADFPDFDYRSSYLLDETYGWFGISVVL